MNAMQTTTGLVGALPAGPMDGKFTYVVLPGNESVLMAEAMQRRSWWRPVEKGSPNNFWWGGNGQRVGWQDYQRGTQLHGLLLLLLLPVCLECFAGVWCSITGVKKQIVNQVEGHSEICTKTRLAENLRRYAVDKKLDCCWVPETYIVSAGLNEGMMHRAWHS